VATHTRAAACSAHTLQEARDGGRSVDLDNAVEGPNVDTKFQDTRRHNDAVISRCKRLFSRVSLLPTQRTMGDERCHLQLTECMGKLLRPCPTVNEHEPLLTTV